MLNLRVRRLTLGLTWLLALAACQAQEGEPCAKSRDCVSPLVCTAWTPMHEKVLGASCDGDRCCMVREHEATVASAEAFKEAFVTRRKQCNALVLASNAHMPKVNGAKVAELDAAGVRAYAEALDGLVADFRKVEDVEGGVAALRDELVKIGGLLAKVAHDLAGAMTDEDDRLAKIRLGDVNGYTVTFSHLHKRLLDDCRWP